MKELYVSDLSERKGEVIEECFLLKNYTPRSDKSGSVWANVEFADKGGVVSGVVFGDNLKPKYQYYKGSIVKVNARVVQKDGQLSLDVKSLVKMPAGEFDMSDFVALLSKEDAAFCYEKIRCHIASVQDLTLRVLLESVFKDKFLDKMRRIPAGVDWHHTGPGMLLVHIMEVADAAAFLCDQQEAVGRFHAEPIPVDKELCVAGALLHDIGKVHEYANFPCFEFSLSSRLVGYVNESLSMLDRNVSKTRKYLEEEMQADFDAQKYARLRHIILSASKTNAVMKPKTIEAMIVSLADRTSSMVDGFHTSFERADRLMPGAQEHYSEYFGYTILRNETIEGGDRDE